MTCRTITRTADGQIVSVECPCGENHGPSLREELDIMREANRRAARKLNELHDDLERVLALTDQRAATPTIRDARRLIRKGSETAASVARNLSLGAL
jgi:mannose/fructose-specific phosphotransferase system component IIA